MSENLNVRFSVVVENKNVECYLYRYADMWCITWDGMPEDVRKESDKDGGIYIDPINYEKQYRALNFDAVAGFQQKVLNQIALSFMDIWQKKFKPMEDEAQRAFLKQREIDCERQRGRMTPAQIKRQNKEVEQALKDLGLDKWKQ